MSNRALLEKYGLEPRLPDHFDHTFTGTHGECERLAYYQFVLGRIPSYFDTIALTWGKTFHAIAEVWQKEPHTPETVVMIDSVIDTNLPEESDDRYGRVAGRMRQLFHDWVIYRKGDTIDIIRPEQSAVILCNSPCPYNDIEGGCQLEYGGRLDDIVRWQGQIGPLDLKTTVMNYTDPVTQFRPSHQMEGYVWITSHLIGEHCWGSIVEQLVCNKSTIKIGRYTMPYAKDLIREWAIQERIRQGRIHEQFQNHAWDEQHWLQNFGRCWSPYPCTYRDTCLSSRDMDFRYKRLRDHTYERRWDFQKITDGPKENV